MYRMSASEYEVEVHFKHRVRAHIKSDGEWRVSYAKVDSVRDDDLA
jgi:hypothetical protein